MKIKKIASVFLLMLLPLTVLITVQCRNEASEPDTYTTRSVVGGFVEEKTYSNATLKDLFADDRVVIVLNQAASMNFKTYTPKDFPEIRCNQVIDSTDLIMEVVRQQIEAEKTRDFSKLKERIKTGMLVDVGKFRRIFDLVLPVKSKENVLEAIKLLEKREDILYVGPDYFMELCELPNPLPAYINNQMAALNSISLPSAWDITVGSSNVLVGVLDSGILAMHAEFTGQMADSYYHRDFTTGTTHGSVAPYGLEDPNGHGTHVAGIIGAKGIGVTGTCWNVKLVSLRVFDANGNLNNYASRIRYAINHATNYNIPILNYSGSILSNYTGFNDVYAAIQQYSGLFVCAAGNDYNDNDINPTFPSNWTLFLDNLVSVGALDNNDNRVAFSNVGEVSVDLFAPGTDIYSTYNNLWYKYDSGTSMAAPYVAGVAALVLSLHPEMTGVQLKTALKNSVDVLPQLSPYCNTGGIINAYKAVNYVPIVGSIDITFNGTTLTTTQGGPVGEILLGKFHLFTNGTFMIAERGKLIYPIPNYAISDSYLECDPVPAGISTYIAQSGLGSIRAGVAFYAPCNTYSNYTQLNYSYLPLSLDVYSSGAEIYYLGGQYYPGEDLLPTDKRKIFVKPNGWYW